MTDLADLTKLALPRTMYVVVTHIPGHGTVPCESGMDSRQDAFYTAAECWGDAQPTRVLAIDLDAMNMPQAVRDITDATFLEWQIAAAETIDAWQRDDDAGRWNYLDNKAASDATDAAFAAE